MAKKPRKETRVRKWVFSDPKKNSNKFWNVHYYDDGTWRAHYGRVGTAGTWGKTRYFSSLDQKIREKIRKLYEELPQATNLDEHVFMTPLGPIPLHQVKKAFSISSKIVEAGSHSADGQDARFKKYMQLLPVDTGRSINIKYLFDKICKNHADLERIIQLSEKTDSERLMEALMGEFLKDMAS